jgi:hypothetical protein
MPKGSKKLKNEVHDDHETTEKCKMQLRTTIPLDKLKKSEWCSSGFFSVLEGTI